MIVKLFASASPWFVTVTTNVTSSPLVKLVVDPLNTLTNARSYAGHDAIVKGTVSELFV